MERSEWTFSNELLLHNPGLPLLKTDRRTGRRTTPPSIQTDRPEEARLVQGSASSAPPPLLNLNNMDCESCNDPSDSIRRKPTPDLLELSSKYETLHRQSLTRTQSGPSRPRALHQVPEQVRPWSDTARLQTKPRQLEPLVNPPHLLIPRQRGLTGLHLSVNYSAQPGQSVRSVLEPIIAISQQGDGQEEDTTL